MTEFEGLAEVINGIRPPGYESAILHAELDDGWASIDLRFSNGAGDEVVSELPDGSGLKIHLILDGIREHMAQASGERWTACAFDLPRGRQFQFKVEYGKRA